MIDQHFSREMMQGSPPGTAHFCFNASLSKIVVCDLHMMFFDNFTVLFRFLADKHFRTIMKLPQKTSFGTKPCSLGNKEQLSSLPCPPPKWDQNEINIEPEIGHGSPHEFTSDNSCTKLI